jgi:hypothetical protein
MVEDAYRAGASFFSAMRASVADICHSVIRGVADLRVDQLGARPRLPARLFPERQRRFVVYERRRDLPRVGVAALAAEAYLPFQ